MTNTENNWTPEHKWPGSLELPRDDRLPNWSSLKAHIVGNCGTVAMAYPDYDRARECVNACKGMEEPASEIERLRAENAQLRSDAETLAKEVFEVRKAQASCVCGHCGKRGPAFAARLNTDASGALTRHTQRKEQHGN